MVQSHGLFLLTCYLVLVLKTATIHGSMFTFPEQDRDIYALESSNVVFHWKFYLSSEKKQNLVKINCGYDDISSKIRRFQILVQKLGQRPLSVNDENFPAEYTGRIDAVPKKDQEIYFKLKGVTKKDERQFHCLMFYWEKELYNIKGPIYSPRYSLQLIKPTKMVECLEAKEYVLQETKSQQFQCHAYGHPLPIVKCTILDSKENEIYVNGGKQKNVTFTVERPTFSMAEIRCEAKQEVVGGKKIVKSSKIKVVGKPRSITLVVQTNPPKTNEIIKLECQFEAYPPVTKVHFFKDGKLKATKEKSSYSFMATSCLNDTGLYYCEAENSVGKSKSRAKMIRLYGRNRLRRDSKLNIKLCQDSNCVFYSSVWYTKYVCSTGCSQTSRVYCFDIAYCMFDSGKTQRTESIYFRRGPNVVGSTEAPTVTIPDKALMVTLGKSITISCTVSGCPKPDVTWSKRGDKRILKTGNSMVLSNIQVNDLGEYTCEAVNMKGKDQGNITISARYMPTQVTFNSNAVQGRIRAGRNLELHCKSISSPSGSYHIYKDGALLTENESGKFSIKQISCSKDTGNYSCIPVNSVGKGPKMTMWIYVEEKPRITKGPVSKRVNLSTTVDLTCEADGCPVPSILWRRKGSTAVIHNGNNLQIKNIRKEDGGTYVCVALNRIGQSTVEGTVTIIADRQSQKRKGNNGLSLHCFTMLPLIVSSALLMFVTK